MIFFFKKKQESINVKLHKDKERFKFTTTVSSCTTEKKTTLKEAARFPSEGVCVDSVHMAQFWKAQTAVTNVDSHAATRSYHLIRTKSPRVPVDDCVPAGWNTNTSPARPNTAETAFGFAPRVIASAALQRMEEAN